MKPCLRALPLGWSLLAILCLPSAACESDSTGGPGANAGSGGAIQGGAGGEAPLAAGGIPGTVLGDGVDFQQCAAGQAIAQPTPANLLFVIDRSGSMNCNPPDGDPELTQLCATSPVKWDPNRPSKWEVVEEALGGVLEVLAERENLSVGLSVFPKPSVDLGCQVDAGPDVPLAPLDESQARLLSEFVAGVVPHGDTPLVGATILSYQFLANELRAGRIYGNSFVVLLTDGSDTCATEAQLQTLVGRDVANATRFDIRTFVIGAPGSEGGRSLLSKIASEGLTASSGSCVSGGDRADVGDCHFDMTTASDFSKDLSSALAAITSDRALSCVFDVPTSSDGRGVDLTQVNVTFASSKGEALGVLQDRSAPCEDGAQGWQYTSDLSSIVLCGAICDAVRADPESEIRVVLGCPTAVVR